MKETSWVAGADILIGCLSADMPNGFLVTLPNSRRVEFLIQETDDGKVSIMLPNDEHGSDFDLWQLDEEKIKGWRGYHLGGVEIMIDPDSIVDKDGNAGAGDLVLIDDRITILATNKDRFPNEVVHLKVGSLNAPSNHHQGMLCRRWALVQRHSGDKLRILFERSPQPVSSVAAA